MPLTSYRYPTELLVLTITILALLLILALTAGVTLCLAPVLVIIFVYVAYHYNRSHHDALLRSAIQVSPQQTPALASLTAECARRLQIPSQNVVYFVAHSRLRNAYTFGLTDPQTVVVYSALLDLMTPDELRFIIGHELGHIALGHTTLNSILGGLGGIPTTFEGAILLTLSFRWWNRVCEYSCDRAGLIACGDLQTAISSLVKLVAGSPRSQAAYEQALARIEQEDDSPLKVLAESFSTHPMIVRRIKHLKEYAGSQEYKRHLARTRS